MTVDHAAGLRPENRGAVVFRVRGASLPGEPPRTRIQTGSRAVASVVAVVIAQVKRYGMVG